MRILASNPDTIGDLVLRQPMYRALLDAGHELTLIVRPIVAPVVRHVAPGAKVIELPYEVYAHDLGDHWARFGELFHTARAFAPDALLVAPYRWTAFDERLADELPGVKRFGLSGHLYRGDPHRGLPPESRLRFDVLADVCEDAPEVEKNAALASAVLGEPRPPLPFPRIDVPEPERSRAAQTLAELGLSPGEFWIACVTGTANVSLKAWHPARWSQALAGWAARHGRRFLFVGLADEEPDARAVRDGMGAVGESHTRVWMPPGGTVDELIGLTALSAGYVGHDTGLMHVAAAAGKPVLAVFGGGHKLRFQPAAEPSVTVTVGVSCRGCQWVCSFAESHCVKAVPVEEVLRAADDLEAGRVRGREARVLEPSHELQARMIHESARIAQDRLRAAADLARQLHGTQANWEQDVARLRADAEARAREAEATRAAQQAAVERAHAELGGQLREKESTIRVQDEQLREKESMIRTQHEQLGEKEQALQAQHALLQAQEGQARQLRAHAEAAAAQNAQLGLALDARTSELARLRDEYEAKAQEAAQLAAAADLQRQEVERLRRDTAASIEQLERANREAGDAAKKQSEEVGRLREQLQRLDEKVRQLEPHVRRPRRPFKQVLVEFVIGPQHYYPPPPKPLPGITVVTVAHNAAATIRDTIESVLGQTHAHVQYVVVDRGSTDGTAAILDEYRGRIDKVVTESADVPPQDALVKGYDLATYDVIGQLAAGDVYEPGALTRVAEHFRDHPGHRAAVFEEAVVDSGWRFPLPARATPDVYGLLGGDVEVLDTAGGVFVTTNAYKAIGGINRDRGAAAMWEFLIRLARRYGIQAGAGHVRTRRVPRGDGGGGGGAQAIATSDGEWAEARKLFQSSFGFPGRVRGTLFHWCNRFDDARRRAAPGRLAYPLPLNGEPLPPGAAPARVPAEQPVCPVDGRLPDRLLFSTRDTTGGDDAISYVYYDASADMALVYPPIDLERLQTIYDRSRTAPARVTPPEPGRLSPYAGYRGRGGGLARVLSRVRSPYWWFRTPQFGDVAVDELLASLDGPVPRRGVGVRFLNVGCYEGAVLDRLKTETDWTVAGTETNADAARVARSKGHTVWETSAQDAALTLPLDSTFDVIYLGGLVEHLPDPLLVLRRLRQVLAPGGRIVIDTPNLDSKLLDAFGPTWSQWQAPYHRTLIGRRGLRKLARRGAFRIERLRTRTHPLAAVKSVQLNDLGLGATVPDTAEFPPDVASRGVLLTGWARLLWDWRGRGDYLYAVLRAE